MAAAPALRAERLRLRGVPSFATARCAAFTWVWVGRRKRRSGAKVIPSTSPLLRVLWPCPGKRQACPRPASDVTSTCHSACEVNAAEAQCTEEPVHPCPLCLAARSTDTINGSTRLTLPPFSPSRCCRVTRADRLLGDARTDEVGKSVEWCKASLKSVTCRRRRWRG
jgi:hypothetical protein